MNHSDQPLRYDLMVPSDGRIEVQVPLAAGAQVTVYVVPQQDVALDELTACAASSMDFWNNSIDDEDWNDA
jgi:hypothetical protein